MNLFRSEEHARNWSEFKPYILESLKPLSFWLERFSSEMMRNRGRPDFISLVHVLAFSTGSAKMNSQWRPSTGQIFPTRAYRHSDGVQSSPKKSVGINKRAKDACLAQRRKGRQDSEKINFFSLRSSQPKADPSSGGVLVR